MSRRLRSDYRLSLGWILGVTFMGTLTRLKLPQWSSLSFGAAVCLRLPPHTTSRRKLSRLATDQSTCSCLRLTVATNSPRKGLSPPIQCPCRAHPFARWNALTAAACVVIGWQLRLACSALLLSCQHIGPAYRASISGQRIGQSYRAIVSVSGEGRGPCRPRLVLSSSIAGILAGGRTVGRMKAVRFQNSHPCQSRIEPVPV